MRILVVLSMQICKDGYQSRLMDEDHEYILF